MTSIRATVSIPKGIAIAINELRKGEDRSFSNQCVVLIKQALAAKETTDGKE